MNAPSSLECRMLATLFDQNQFAKVAALARSLTIRFPLYGYGWKALGVGLYEQGKLDEALVAMQKAAELLSDDAEAHFNLAFNLHDQRRFMEAEASLRRALELKPDYAEAHSALGSVFWEQGRLIEAEISFSDALKINPNQVDALINLGIVFWSQARSAEAEACFRKALEINPDIAEAHNNLGEILLGQASQNEAEHSFRRALEINSDFILACNNLANILVSQGRADEAEIYFRRALEINPENVIVHNNLLFFRSHYEKSGMVLSAEHCRFGEQFEAPLRAFWSHHRNSRDPERCLQVGIMSGDLCDHTMANIIEPILASLTDYPQLELHAYYNHSVEDNISRSLRKHVKHWHSIADLSDEVLAEKIRADGIDILIDFSGHTNRNRLLTFARKPAPIQVSWMAYPGTTGLSAMDYQLTDRFFLPLGQFDDQFVEKVVRLPASFMYQIYLPKSPINALPALNNGYVTFGSFNRPNKLIPSVIAVWSQLLRAVPDSRLLLGSMSTDGKYDVLIDWFAKEGIVRERLSFHARCEMTNYLALHQQVDICLDTFPYNGVTTTLNALWMSVPTLTLTGDTVASRSGAGILGHVGLDAFVARDEADFVQKGAFWASDLSSLAKVRAGLRERFEQSVMRQPTMFAAGLECALRMMWQRWCAGLSAESFEVGRHVSDKTAHR